MFKNIIWDFDGTLFDSYPVMASTMIETLRAHGIEEDQKRILNLMKVSMTTLINDLIQRYHVTDLFVNQYLKNLKIKEQRDSKPFPGAVEICRYIKECGGSNHLFTHKSSAAIDLLKKYDLEVYFDGMITSESGFSRKPSPEGILHLIERYDSDPSKTLMVGDRELDLLSAKHAGISACYFKQVHDKDLQVADYVIRDLLALKDLMERERLDDDTTDN
jgi:HAD superfamily hydrolase (TIGR01549 family)